MCYRPRLAFRTGEINPDTGKNRIRFIPQRIEADHDYEWFKNRYGKDLVLIPCGECPSCLKQYSYSWTIRLICESLYHEKNCFLTLTYDPKHLPKVKSVVRDDGVVRSFHPLVKKDLQDFFKRLRFHFPGVSIRYFACGEHGDEVDELGWLGRPHYHVILFGLDFVDKTLVKHNVFNQPLFTSKTLESIWQNGLVSIGEVTSQSCGYVARYSLKKRVSEEKTDEFVLMSRKPCLGWQYYQDHKSEIYLSDKIYHSKLNSISIPRAFDKLAENDSDLSVFFDYQARKVERQLKADGKEYQNMIAFGFKHIEDAQFENISRALESMSLLRRSLC